MRKKDGVFKRLLKFLLVSTVYIFGICYISFTYNTSTIFNMLWYKFFKSVGF
jgi:hypothetical protein